MGDSDFDGRLARLIENLDEAANLLRDHGETRWLKWATKCRGELTMCNVAAFNHVLGAFGGMGSLNDLMILRVNGHTIKSGAESTVNRRLSDLLRAIWEDATDLKKDLQSPS